MNILENRRSFNESIGEFITAFAQVELYVTMYDAIIKTKNTKNLPLAGSFSVPVKKKLKNISRFILEGFNKDFNECWVEIQKEIMDLYLFRNHIIHGTGASSFYGEYTKTMIDEDQQLLQLNFKNLSIEDIKKLSQRTYHVLTGDNGIQGVFMQEFLKISRSLFSQSNLT
ncbi:hypothetical protein [Mucilaginibacter sp.]|uniref:hypothetical protein n=1 Tax=Mucilaginibacter sp. TaxID=1882438 RepID=UPI0028511F96|nr:hypothetical protein [Mucilaginibacter sp.]MDR3697488.1 hypothetical protein [Mucilaginibacter sp.]